MRFHNKTIFEGNWDDIVEGTYKIPPGITTIGRCAFSYCRSLQTITLPAGVTTIGDFAFSDCRSLQTIILPAGVTTIGERAFSDCRSLQTIILPAGGVTTIGDEAFSYCYSLETITLPAGVTAIGRQAFFRCRSLQTITLPAGLNTISPDAFDDCHKLTSIIIDSNDEAEMARITHLLPEALRSKVISKGLFDDIVRFQERQLAKLLFTPQTNPLYRFFHDTNGFMLKNEAGEAIKKACIKLPDDIFVDINEQLGGANPYYKHAQDAIKFYPIPKTTKAFEDYKESIDLLITQYIVKAKEQVQRFRVSKTLSVANEEGTVCAPAV